MEQTLKWPDLSSRGEAPLEWWFVQGYLEGDGFERHEFMLSLFRQTRSRDGAGVHMALLSTLEAKTGRHRVRSQVSPEFVENFVHEAPRQLRKWGIEDHLADTFIQELAESGPPEPILSETAPVELTAQPFKAAWGDLLLSQSGDSITIGFRLPEDGRSCALEARSRAGWLTEERAGGGGVGPMAYYSCPRLTAGYLDQVPVSGEAWIDHQWGDYGWFRGADGDARLLGWDWFGINLSDGTDLIAIVHRDMRTRQAVDSSAIAFFPGERPRTVGEVSIAATRHWLSPETMIEYPVAWRIDIPSLAAKLSFEPAADNQEVPVFGFIDAIWEGAGHIEGTIDGGPVSGRARLELQGYGYIHDFKAHHRRWIDRVDRNIRAYFPETLDGKRLAAYLGQPRWRYDADAHTAMLSEPMWDLMARGGKHWRPIFGIMLLQALGVEPGPFETMLSVIPELGHNAAVVIDDIEDGSQTRRGEETVHIRYGLETAINAANTLYFLPLLSISNHPHLTAEQRDATYRLIVEMFVQAHFGQAQDLYWSKLDPAARAALWQDEKLGELILQAHAFKTASVSRATAEFVCIIANADAETRDACRNFAESWGVAFQIIDDVNNFTKAPEWGKVRGEDVAGGKFSYAIHKAVQRLSGFEKQRLVEILSGEELRRSEAGLQEAIALIEGSGAFKECRREAKQLMDEAWPAFSRILPASRHKIMLRILLTKLIDLPAEA